MLSVGIEEPVYVWEMTRRRQAFATLDAPGKNSCALLSIRHQGTFTGTEDRRKKERKIGEIVNHDYSTYQQWYHGPNDFILLYMKGWVCL